MKSTNGGRGKSIWRLRVPWRLRRRSLDANAGPEEQSRCGKGEEGATLVEMALVCCFVLLPTIFGIIEVAYAFYAFNFVSSASREATRYAIVRGSTSCTIAPSFPNCNLSPSSSGNPLQTYVQGLGYPGLNTGLMTANATWWKAHLTNPAGSFSTTDWDTQCTTVDNFGYACNHVRNAVQVVVTYQFPLNIPFWKSLTIPISSSAKMVISE